MNEIVYGFGWGLKGIELLILLFWVHKFSKMRRKLFFGVKKDLASVQHHELYSCFLTAFCFLIFHLISSELEQFLVALEMDKVEHIKLFYTSMAIMHFSFILTLFCLHLVRGCTFSSTARICVYTRIIYIMLLGMELISRGYYDYHDLGMVYIVGAWLCNFVAIAALATYPIRSIKEQFKQKRAAAS
ncbi:hypothetical protein PSECIP111951_00420 [Pseudoalteromonas holothuriae]|uniref:Uncharacterized protein n=1 Tax=Pseudoalteromonas holothuriae TaxID=2963714 RepID=A0ABN8UK41_9GAMM|nr:hypothetical protein [Pseudoalteromonas sp. CIP111951]CAH9051574.1 hypothetical protein PSECIP111951_00420 [Pseudoalteromonas sp. CIP111951]